MNAPTPARLAVQEDWTELPNVKDISDGLSRAHESFDRAYFRADSPDHMRRAVEETREHLTAVLAELPDAPRPEPGQVLKLDLVKGSSIQVGDLSDDGLLIGPGYFEAGPNAPEWARRAAAQFPRPETVVAPLPSEAGALVLATIGPRTIPLELQATGVWLSPGRHGSYIAADIDSWVRLVPEDDEDTVRMPRKAVEQLRDWLAPFVHRDGIRLGSPPVAKIIKGFLATLDGAR